MTYEDYALRSLHDAGVGVARTYGVVELHPNREYMLVTQFFEGGRNLSDSDVDDTVIDEGLDLVRRLWDAGFAHRDLKPANLLVVGGHLQLVDVSALEVRPSPWRQAVDLANMMLCLALRTDADRVYARATSVFTPDEVAKGFASSVGLAIRRSWRRSSRPTGGRWSIGSRNSRPRATRSGSSDGARVELHSPPPLAQGSSCWPGCSSIGTGRPDLGVQTMTLHPFAAVAGCFPECRHSRGSEPMIEALIVGLVASSSLLIGAAIVDLPPGSGANPRARHGIRCRVLISAVAYDLVADALEFARGGSIVIGLFAGAAAFFIGDLLIDRKGGSGRKATEGHGSSSSAMAIVLGTILDGIPESVVLGLTLLDGEGVSIAVLVAVFLSNLPEAMASTTGFVKAGRPASRIMVIWLAVVGVSGLSSMLGFVLLGDAPSATIAIVQGSRPARSCTMLADTMMPEAFEHGGAVAGLATTVGFALAFLIATVEQGG